MPLPADVEGLYGLMEPLFGPLSEENADHATIRKQLPEALPTTARMGGTMIESEDALVVSGTAVIEGSLELEGDGSALVVLGDLIVKGGIFSKPGAYSLIVVGGTLEIERVHTSGDVIAFGGIMAKLWWGRYSDHSTYAPFLDTEVYIAADRYDHVHDLRATTKLGDFNLDAELAARFPGLLPADSDSIRAFIGVEPPRPFVPGTLSTGEYETMRSELDAAWALSDRRAKVKALRDVYRKLKKRRLQACGELLVEMIARKHHDSESWSIQDELGLLARLRRADLLEALPVEQLSGHDGWLSGGLLEQARRA